MEAAGLQHRVALANDCHRPLVEVTERWQRGIATDAPRDQSAGVASLLHRNLSDAAERLSVLVERCGVSEHEDVRMSSHREVALNAHAACAIRVDVQPPAS